MAASKWTRADKLRVRSILKRLRQKVGGWQGIADQLQMESDSSRATVHAWYQRGRVPLPHVQGVIRLVSEHDPETKITPSGLNPSARYLETSRG